MAAWTARIDSVASDGNSITVHVGFFLATDVAFANQLYGKQYVIDKDITAPVLRQMVQNDGASARAILAQRDNLLPQVGQTLSIP